MMLIRFGYAIPTFVPVYDAPEVVEKEEKEKEEKGKVKLTTEQQQFVNSLLAEERRKAQAKNDALITQLETEKNRGGTTAAEKLQLEERIEQLKNEYATKDELKKRETDKKLAELEAKAKDLEAESTTWKSRYERDLKKIALTEAAVKEKAFNPNQVVNELFDKSRHVEILDEEGRPTGEYETRVKIKSKDKTGKEVVLDLTPVEAVKQLKEAPEYENLFITAATGGLGGSNIGRGRDGGRKMSELSTEEYIAERRKARTGGR